jgi:hypothetical protein
MGWTDWSSAPDPVPSAACAPARHRGRAGRLCQGSRTVPVHTNRPQEEAGDAERLRAHLLRVPTLDLSGTHRRADFPDTGSRRRWPRWDAQTPFLSYDTCDPTCSADTAICMRQRRMHRRGLARASDASSGNPPEAALTPISYWRGVAPNWHRNNACTCDPSHRRRVRCVPAWTRSV